MVLCSFFCLPLRERMRDWKLLSVCYKFFKFVSFQYETTNWIPGFTSENSARCSSFTPIAVLLSGTLVFKRWIAFLILHFRSHLASIRFNCVCRPVTMRIKSPHPDPHCPAFRTLCDDSCWIWLFWPNSAFKMLSSPNEWNEASKRSPFFFAKNKQTHNIACFQFLCITQQTKSHFSTQLYIHQKWSLVRAVWQWI